MAIYFDTATEIASENESGAAVCRLAEGVELLVSDRGETFTIWDRRPNAKRLEKVVSAAWAYKFLGAVRRTTITSFDY